MDQVETEKKIAHLNHMIDLLIIRVDAQKKMISFLEQKDKLQDEMMELVEQKNKSDVSLIKGFNSILNRLDIEGQEHNHKIQELIKGFDIMAETLKHQTSTHIALRDLLAAKGVDVSNLKVVK